MPAIYVWYSHFAADTSALLRWGPSDMSEHRQLEVLKCFSMLDSSFGKITRDFFVIFVIQGGAICWRAFVAVMTFDQRWRWNTEDASRINALKTLFANICKKWSCKRSLDGHPEKHRTSSSVEALDEFQETFWIVFCRSSESFTKRALNHLPDVLCMIF